MSRLNLLWWVIKKSKSLWVLKKSLASNQRRQEFQKQLILWTQQTRWQRPRNTSSAAEPNPRARSNKSKEEMEGWFTNSRPLNTPRGNRIQITFQEGRPWRENLAIADLLVLKFKFIKKLKLYRSQVKSRVESKAPKFDQRPTMWTFSKLRSCRRLTT